MRVSLSASWVVQKLVSQRAPWKARRLYMESLSSFPPERRPVSCPWSLGTSAVAAYCPDPFSPEEPSGIWSPLGSVCTPRQAWKKRVSQATSLRSPCVGCMVQSSCSLPGGSWEFSPDRVALHYLVEMDDGERMSNSLTATPQASAKPAQCIGYRPWTGWFAFAWGVGIS